jgi:hypothetical protein
MLHVAHICISHTFHFIRLHGILHYTNIRIISSPVRPTLLSNDFFAPHPHCRNIYVVWLVESRNYLKYLHTIETSRVYATWLVWKTICFCYVLCMTNFDSDFSTYCKSEMPICCQSGGENSKYVCTRGGIHVLQFYFLFWDETRLSH